MQHLQSIPTCKDIVEEAYLCKEDFPLWVQPSRSSIPKGPLWNGKSCVPMTSCPQSVGLDTSWKPKDTKFMTMFFPGQQECNSFGKEWKGFKQQAYKAHQYLVLLYDQLHWQGWCIIGLVSDRRHVGDFMTKPLQGALFWKFRDQIMGVVPAQNKF